MSIIDRARLPEVLIKLDKMFTKIQLDKLRHSTKQAHMQGGLWNQYTDPIEGEKCYNCSYEKTL